MATFLNITEDEVRALEASAIKRLQEPDCIGYFVKKFGSKELLMKNIEQEIEQADAVSITLANHDGLEDKATESELAQFLDAMENIHDLYKRWYRRLAESTS